MKARQIIAFGLIAMAAGSVFAQRPKPGIVGKPAPEWAIDEWYNLPEGVASIDIDDYRGKVLYLFAFQAWCPGCHSHGFPTMRAVREAYAGDPDVQFVAVQTVFEGFDVNVAERARESCDKFGLDVPCGHDPGSDGKRSNLLRRYRTGGTPWTIIVDRGGVVRFNGFRITPGQAKELIDRLLLDEPPPSHH